MAKISEKIFHAALITFSIVALSSTNSIAGSYVKEITETPTKAAKLRLHETNHGAEWVVLEREDCYFFISYKDKKKKHKKNFSANDCSAIANTDYKVLGSDILIVNLASERGGYAYIVHASEKQMYWIDFEYKSSDESKFIATRKKSNISIETDMTKINAEILKNGKIIIKSTTSTTQK